MRSSAVFTSLLAGLAAAQESVSVVVTNGVTSTIVLPGWPSGTPASGASSSETGSVLSSVTITVHGGTASGITVPATTLTIVPSAIPSGSTFGPGPFGASSSVKSSSSPATVPTSPANGTTTAPTTVPTAAADRLASLPGSMASLVVALVLSVMVL